MFASGNDIFIYMHVYIYVPLLIFSLTTISQPASSTAFVNKKIFSRQAIFTVNRGKYQGTLLNVMPSLSNMPHVVVKQANDKKTADNPKVYPDLTSCDLPNATETR